MSHLHGSSEVADQLQSEIFNVAEEIKNLLISEGKSLMALSESCHDDSYSTMEHVVRQITLYTKSIVPDLAAVCSRLQAYRDLIQSLDSSNYSIVSESLSAKGYDKAIQKKWICSYQCVTVKQNGRVWTAELGTEQKEAIRAYTSTAYADINATLRGIRKKFYSEENKSYAKLIHSALEAHTIPCDCVVYRGMNSAALGPLEKLSDQELIGAVFTDNGFMSTSLSLEDAFGGSVQLEIEVPKGAKGAYVGYISQQGHTESEVLFDMGQYIQILNVKRDQYGNRKIHARMM